MDRKAPIDLSKFDQEKFRLNLSSEYFKNSGANIVQEIAFTLSAGIDYVNKFGEALFNKISFELIQGNNYFFEVAKIQALRILWSIISKKYGNQIDDCIITAKPSSKNKRFTDFSFVIFLILNSISELILEPGFVVKLESVNIANNKRIE